MDFGTALIKIKELIDIINNFLGLSKFFKKKELKLSLEIKNLNLKVDSKKRNKFTFYIGMMLRNKS